MRFTPCAFLLGVLIQLFLPRDLLAQNGAGIRNAFGNTFVVPPSLVNHQLNGYGIPQRPEDQTALDKAANDYLLGNIGGPGGLSQYADPIRQQQISQYKEQTGRDPFTQKPIATTSAPSTKPPTASGRTSKPSTSRKINKPRNGKGRPTKKKTPRKPGKRK
jgi:hypothetical protein